MNDNEDTCPATGERHVPDWSTINVDHDGVEYLDVSCRDFERSGCVGPTAKLAESITW